MANFFGVLGIFWNCSRLSLLPTGRMADACYETDHAIALALKQRQRSEENAQAQEYFDESLARALQDEEITHRERPRYVTHWSQPQLILIAVH